MSFKLKMKVLLFLVSSVVSFSAQNENFQMNIKNNDVNNRESYLISAVKRKNKNKQENIENLEKFQDLIYNLKTNLAFS